MNIYFLVNNNQRDSAKSIQKTPADEVGFDFQQKRSLTTPFQRRTLFILVLVAPPRRV